MTARVLLVVVMLVAKLEATQQQEQQGAEVPVVDTLLGKVAGVREHSSSGRPFFSYHAIPFARPPTGPLRFKDPVAPERWEGVRDCSRMSSVCHQVDMMAHFQGLEVAFDGSEDCLYLNVFTPQVSREGAGLPSREGAGLPVLVFIHGGAFIGGGATWHTPYLFLDQDLVLVTINYRLGVLGFLSTEDDVMPGNFGLKDQTMALRWVHDNIRSFGGDPAKLAIFGVSAGGASVHYQILTPYSTGLFSRAIMQSGSALCPWAQGGAHRQVAEYAGEMVGCSTPSDSHALLKCLQDAPADQLTVLSWSLTEWEMHPFIVGPRVDGDFLPAAPSQLLKDGNHQAVDIISGVTQDEGTFVSFHIYKNQDALNTYNHNISALRHLSLEFSEGDVDVANTAKRIFEYYTGTSNPLTVEDADAVTEMMSDRYFRLPHEVSLEHHARNLASNTVFSYLLTHKATKSIADFFPDRLTGSHWVGHGDDIFFLFQGGFFGKSEREEDLELGRKIIKMWANFAATGKPTPDASLGFTWEPWSENRRHHLDLNPSPSMVQLPRQKVRDFWSSLPLLENIILHPEKVDDLPRHWLSMTGHQRCPVTQPDPSDTQGDPTYTSQGLHHQRKPVKVPLRDEL